MGGAQDTLGRIDHGTHLFRQMVQRHEYEVAGHRVKTLEEAERIALDYGINLQKFTAEILPQGGGKCNVLVKFVSPEERAKRSSW